MSLWSLSKDAPAVCLSVWWVGALWALAGCSCLSWEGFALSDCGCLGHRERSGSERAVRSGGSLRWPGGGSASPAQHRQRRKSLPCTCSASPDPKSQCTLATVTATLELEISNGSCITLEAKQPLQRTRGPRGLADRKPGTAEQHWRGLAKHLASNIGSYLGSLKKKCKTNRKQVKGKE